MKAELERLLSEKTGNVVHRLSALHMRAGLLLVNLRGEGCGGGMTGEEILTRAIAELRHMLTIAEGTHEV